MKLFHIISFKADYFLDGYVANLKKKPLFFYILFFQLYNFPERIKAAMPGAERQRNEKGKISGEASEGWIIRDLENDK